MRAPRQQPPKTIPQQPSHMHEPKDDNTCICPIIVCFNHCFYLGEELGEDELALGLVHVEDALCVGVWGVCVWVWVWVWGCGWVGGWVDVGMIYGTCRSQIFGIWGRAKLQLGRGPSHYTH
jgi:hypothetical protein